MFIKLALNGEVNMLPTASYKFAIYDKLLFSLDARMDATKQPNSL